MHERLEHVLADYLIGKRIESVQLVTRRSDGSPTGITFLFDDGTIWTAECFEVSGGDGFVTLVWKYGAWDTDSGDVVRITDRPETSQDL